MSRARYMQEDRKMRFEDAYEGWIDGRLTQAEAAMLLRQCERSFRRQVEHYKLLGVRAQVVQSRFSRSMNAGLRKIFSRPTLCSRKMPIAVSSLR